MFIVWIYPYTHWTLMFPHLDITYEYVYWTFSKHTVYAFFIPTSNSYWWIENCPIVNSNELWLRQKILLLKRNCLFKSKLCFYWARSWPNRSLKIWWFLLFTLIVLHSWTKIFFFFWQLISIDFFFVKSFWKTPKYLTA